MTEELEGNPHLENFYEYMNKKIPGVNPHGFPLQKFFLIERCKKEANFSYTNNILIQDRCVMEQFEIFTKTMFDDEIINLKQFQFMQSLFEEKLKEVMLPNIIIFLDSDPQVNMERI